MWVHLFLEIICCILKVNPAWLTFRDFHFKIDKEGCLILFTLKRILFYHSHIIKFLHYFYMKCVCQIWPFKWRYILFSTELVRKSLVFDKSIIPFTADPLRIQRGLVKFSFCHQPHSPIYINILGESSKFV